MCAPGVLGGFVNTLFKLQMEEKVWVLLGALKQVAQSQCMNCRLIATEIQFKSSSSLLDSVYKGQGDEARMFA